MASILRFDNWQNSDGTSIATTDASGNISFAGSLGATAGVGKILQVVTATTSTTVTTTVNGFVDTGLSATITPTSASSDILIFMTAPLTMEGSSQYLNATIFRGTVATGTNLATAGGTPVLAHGYSASVTGGLRQTVTPFVLDSPATTSATTYTGAFSRSTSGTGVFCKGGNPAAFMLLMEVAS
jgi:hypothetical protein